MPQRKSGCRLGQACPAALSIAKSAEAVNAGATQHSPKQLAVSAQAEAVSLGDGLYMIAFLGQLCGLLADHERCFSASTVPV